MSDDERRVPREEPIEPILLPESPYASAALPQDRREQNALPAQPLVPPPRPRVWTVWLVFVAAMLANVLVVAVLLVALAAIRLGAGAASPDDLSRAALEVAESPFGLLSTVSATMVIFSAFAVAAAVASPVPLIERLRLQAARISVLGMALHLCGPVAMGLIFGGLVALGLLPESPALAELTELVERLSGAGLLAAVVVIGIAPGIAEELLFRGYIQTRFCQRWGVGWGILWTSLLFAVMHMDLIHGLFAFGLGVYLGYLTEITRSIRPAILCHATNNTFSTLMTGWGVDIEGTGPNLAALAVGMLVLGLCVRHLRTKGTVTYTYPG